VTLRVSGPPLRGVFFFFQWHLNQIGGDIMSTPTASAPSLKKVSLITLREKKERGEPI
ncbi:uncharacterized protein METZ01_LOCUS304089, partial [marine metagenome]